MFLNLKSIMYSLPRIAHFVYSRCHFIHKSMRDKLKCKVSVGSKAPRRSAFSVSIQKGPSVLLTEAKRKACQLNATPLGSDADRTAVIKEHLPKAQQIQSRAIKALEELRDLEFQMMMESKTTDPFFTSGSFDMALKAVKSIEIDRELLDW